MLLLHASTTVLCILMHAAACNQRPLPTVVISPAEHMELASASAAQRRLDNVACYFYNQFKCLSNHQKAEF